MKREETEIFRVIESRLSTEHCRASPPSQFLQMTGEKSFIDCSEIESRVSMTTRGPYPVTKQLHANTYQSNFIL